MNDQQDHESTVPEGSREERHDRPLTPPYAGGPYPPPTPQRAPAPGQPGPGDTQRFQFAGPGYASQPHHSPLPMAGRPEQRGRVSGWVWPAVAVLALVVGLLGGALGGIAVQSWQGDGSGRVPGGLDSVDTVSTPPLEADNGSIAAVAQKLLPSTVQIVADLDGKPRGATGSGFVLDRQGHIVTNNHVVAGAAGGGAIEVIDSEGTKYDATLVGRRPVAALCGGAEKPATRSPIMSSSGRRVS